MNRLPDASVPPATCPRCGLMDFIPVRFTEPSGAAVVEYHCELCWLRIAVVRADPLFDLSDQDEIQTERDR